MKSALIIKTSAIGDILQSFDVVAYLKERQGIERVDWVVEKTSARIVEAHPGIHEAIIVDTKAWRKRPVSIPSFKQIAAVRKKLRVTAYDAVFDLQGNSKSALFTLWAQSPYKVGYSWQNLPEKSNWLVTTAKIPTDMQKNVRSRYLSLVQGFFRDDEPFAAKAFSFSLTEEEREHVAKKIIPSSTKHIALCCGSNWPNKCLKDPAILSLCQKMREMEPCHFYFVWGNPQEKERGERLASHFPEDASTVGNLNLLELHAFLASMDGIVAMDSAPLHLAALTETPTYSFFGPSRLEIYKPLGSFHQGAQGRCPYGVSFAYRCPKLRTCPTGACMDGENLQGVSFEEWFRSLESQVASR